MPTKHLDHTRKPLATLYQQMNTLMACREQQRGLRTLLSRYMYE